MTMTVNKLHQILSEQIAQGHGSRTIGIDLDTLSAPTADASIVDVSSADAEWIAESDGNGYVVQNADGSERGLTMLILSGK